MIKPARRNQYPQILELERKSNEVADEDFQAPSFLSGTWFNQEDFDSEIAEKNAVAVVALQPEPSAGDKIVGFAVYYFNKEKKNIQILKMEGDKAAEYEILKHIEDAARKYSFNRIVMLSHEFKTKQHLSLQNLGGIARKTKHKAFGDNDGYLFQWDIV